VDEIIVGRNPVLEALRAGRPIHKIMLARNASRHGVVAEILHLAQNDGIPVEYVPDAVLQQTGSPKHQGIIACAAAKDYVSLDDLLAVSREKGEPPLYCILDGVEDPQNLGAIIRTAEASGIHGVIIRSRRAAGMTAAVAKASAGAVEYLPVARVVNITQSILTLQKQGIWVAGIDATGNVDYRQLDVTGPFALVIGGEGQGLSELVRKKCDFLARIPMRGKIGSLNASVAAALVMYEAFHQRQHGSGNTP